MKNTRPIAGAVAAAAAVVALTGCTIASTAPDQNALVYNGGWNAKDFANCVGPSDRTYNSPMKNVVYYPAGLRSYVFSNEREDGKTDNDLVGDVPAFSAPSKDQVLLTVSGQVSFSLTSDCDLLRKFHEQIGIKFDNGADWSKILQTYLATAVNRAVTEATQQYEWTKLYGNLDGAQVAWEKTVKDALPIRLREMMGLPAVAASDKPTETKPNDFFRDIQVTLQKPMIPGDLQKSVESFAQAVADNNAQQQRNAQVLSEADGLKPLIAALGGDANALNVYMAIKSGKITFMPMPSNSSVIVSPPR